MTHRLSGPNEKGPSVIRDGPAAPCSLPNRDAGPQVTFEDHSRSPNLESGALWALALPASARFPFPRPGFPLPKVLGYQFPGFAICVAFRLAYGSSGITPRFPAYRPVAFRPSGRELTHQSLATLHI